MLDTKELQIGNWVYESKIAQFPMQVKSIGEDYCYLDFEENEGDMFDGLPKEMLPIPFTFDLAEKIGFVREYSLVEGMSFETDEHKITVSKNIHTSSERLSCIVEDCNYNTLGIFSFSYLHELQNGVRLITKKDLQIKL